MPADVANPGAGAGLAAPVGLVVGRSGRAALLLSLPAIALYVVIFCIPLLMTFVLSFRTFDLTTGAMGHGLTLERYFDVLSDPYFYEVFARTFLIAAIVTVISVVLGTPEAYILSRLRPPWRSVFLLIVLGPLLVSVVVRTLGWAILLGNSGLLNQALMSIGIVSTPLAMMYTNGAVVLGLVHISVPFVVISVWTALQRHDPVLERAALALGATRATVFMRVVIPQVMPGMLSGGIVAFSLAASAFATPALLGGRGVKLVSTTVFDEFLGSLDWPLGAAIAVLLLLANTLIVVSYGRLVEGRYRESFR